MSSAKLASPGVTFSVLIMGFTCVAAIGPNGQLGENNDLPWPPGSIRGDMNYFKFLTLSNVRYSDQGQVEGSEPAHQMANVVIMGRKTWESIPLKFRPLESRLNIIITSSKNIESRYKLIL